MGLGKRFSDRKEQFFFILRFSSAGNRKEGNYSLHLPSLEEISVPNKEK
jgi:hypothetical protein